MEARCFTRVHRSPSSVTRSSLSSLSFLRSRAYQFSIAIESIHVVQLSPNCQRGEQRFSSKSVGFSIVPCNVHRNFSWKQARIRNVSLFPFETDLETAPSSRIPSLLRGLSGDWHPRETVSFRISSFTRPKTKNCVKNVRRTWHGVHHVEVLGYFGRGRVGLSPCLFLFSRAPFFLDF